MKMQLIGRVIMPDTLTDKNYYDKKNEKIRDMVDQMMGQCDVAKVTLKDKREFFVAEINKMGGVCDDCTEFRKADIATYAFYKEEV